MKINYFQSGGSTPYRIASPDKAYEDPLDIIKLRLNQAGFEGTKVILPGTTKPLGQLSPVSTYSNPLFKSALNEAWWLKQANDATGGLFKTINDIISWQKANGLAADGKFGKNSIVKWKELNQKSNPIIVPHYTDLPYIAMIQAINGQKPTGLIDNTTATLLRINRDMNNQARQNKEDEQENLKRLLDWLERLWDLYEYDAVNNALKDPNNYYGLPLSYKGNSWGKTDSYKLKGLDAANENYENGYGLYNPAYALKRNALDLSVPSRKKGGQINYFQQGGQMQQDPVGQVIQGLLQDPQGTMQALSQMQGQQGGKEQVNAILQEIVKRAKSGDQQAVQAIQVLQQAMQGGQQSAPQQAPVAKNGAKLNYLKQLKGKCPEGEELVYMKKGGVVCPICQKKKLEEGAKVNKTEFFKKDTKKPLDKCGGKMKAKKKK